MLISAKCCCQQNSRDVSRDLYEYFYLLYVKYNCAKVYLCVTDFRPPLYMSSPKKGLS